MESALTATDSKVARVTYKSRLHQMTQTTPTVLWNDSADIDELNYAIESGAVGATCNPVIAVGILKKHIAEWRPRIEALLRELPGATEDQIGWKLVEEMSVRAAKRLEPAQADVVYGFDLPARHPEGSNRRPRQETAPGPAPTAIPSCKQSPVLPTACSRTSSGTRSSRSPLQRGLTSESADSTRPG